MEYDIVKYENEKIICYFKKGTYSESFENLTKEYKEQGELHRLDGPAYIDSSDQYAQEYYQNGKLHRLDGPAKYVKEKIIYGIPTRAQYHNKAQWYINGILLSEEKVKIIKLWMESANGRSI